MSGCLLATKMILHVGWHFICALFDGTYNTLTVSSPGSKAFLSPNRKCLGYDTKLHIIARLHIWWSGKFDLRLSCHYSQVHSSCSGPIYASTWSAQKLFVFDRIVQKSNKNLLQKQHKNANINVQWRRFLKPWA